MKIIKVHLNDGSIETLTITRDCPDYFEKDKTLAENAFKVFTGAQGIVEVINGLNQTRFDLISF